MKTVIFCLLALTIGLGYTSRTTSGTGSPAAVIAKGQMPNLATDQSGVVHMVFGDGDSLLYSFSTDRGEHFSESRLVAVVPRLAASATRGPQVAISSKGIVVLAVNQEGNIYSFFKDQQSGWKKTATVNDTKDVDKEGFLGLSADGPNAFAMWLDLRGNKKNKIYGARSSDGGKTWSKNIHIYSSPDTTVCQCCKPSVAMRGQNVVVMFRNWLNGNRDLYLVQSEDGGNHFGEAQKLGMGSWPLNGCPMDGGALVLNNEGKVETVWPRKGRIFTCRPGEPEQQVGEGRGCTLASINGKNIYAWAENGMVVCLLPGARKTILGKGQLPQLKQVADGKLLCVWENDKEISRAVLSL